MIFQFVQSARFVQLMIFQIKIDVHRDFARVYITRVNFEGVGVKSTPSRLCMVVTVSLNGPVKIAVTLPGTSCTHYCRVNV